MGHFGDRLGRKSVLVWSLMLMGLSTFAIGVLPTYAQLGAWAPVLLVALRFVQGFALGGEWDGAGSCGGVWAQWRYGRCALAVRDAADSRRIPSPAVHGS